MDQIQVEYWVVDYSNPTGPRDFSVYDRVSESIEPPHDRARRQLLWECAQCGSAKINKHSSAHFTSERCTRQRRRDALIASGLVDIPTQFQSHSQGAYLSSSQTHILAEYGAQECGYMWYGSPELAVAVSRYLSGKLMKVAGLPSITKWLDDEGLKRTKRVKAKPGCCTKCGEPTTSDGVVVVVAGDEHRWCGKHSTQFAQAFSALVDGMI